MKIENIREVKTRFSCYIRDFPRPAQSSLPKTAGSTPHTDPDDRNTDLEVLALSQNKRFWSLIDKAIARDKNEGFIDLKDLQ